MCRLFSGIATKKKIYLAPAYNQSHSTLLEKLNIEDSTENAYRVFVRMELIPYNNDLTTDIGTWKFVVDQDVVPEWFVNDRRRYEDEFRDVVKDWIEKNTVIMAGKSWTPFKTDEKGTYYLLNKILFESEFGKNNNYAESYITKKLAECDLAAVLKDEMGDQLVNISLDLLSLDGLRDYGVYEGDVLEIPTLDLYREGREKIINFGRSFYTATPDSTQSGSNTSAVRCVGGSGGVGYRGCDWDGGVRPFCIVKS